MTLDDDLGEADKVQSDVVVTKKGIVDEDRFYVPKNLAERYDGDKIWFKIFKTMHNCIGAINF